MKKAECSASYCGSIATLKTNKQRNKHKQTNNNHTHTHKKSPPPKKKFKQAALCSWAVHSTPYMLELHMCAFIDRCTHWVCRHDCELSNSSGVTATKQIINLLITEPEGPQLCSSVIPSFCSLLPSS